MIKASLTDSTCHCTAVEVQFEAHLSIHTCTAVLQTGLKQSSKQAFREPALITLLPQTTLGRLFCVI